MIGKDVFDRVLRIARLHLTDEERQEFLKDLEDIIEAFAYMDQASVDHLKPAFHPWIEDMIEDTSGLRLDDEPRSFEHLEELRSSLSLNSDGYMWGPRVRKK